MRAARAGDPCVEDLPSLKPCLLTKPGRQGMAPTARQRPNVDVSAAADYACACHYPILQIVRDAIHPKMNFSTDLGKRHMLLTVIAVDTMSRSTI
jgi:hypothetical protein